MLKLLRSEWCGIMTIYRKPNSAFGMDRLNSTGVGRIDAGFRVDDQNGIARRQLFPIQLGFENHAVTPDHFPRQRKKLAHAIPALGREFKACLGRAQP